MSIESEIAAMEEDAEVVRWATLVEAALLAPPPAHGAPAGASVLTQWTALRSEIHDLLCTSSAKYRDERKMFDTTLKPALAALSAFLTHDFGVAAATASAFSSLALLVPLRVAKNAWCAAYEANKHATEQELEQLEKIADPKGSV